MFPRRVAVLAPAESAFRQPRSDWFVIDRCVGGFYYADQVHVTTERSSYNHPATAYRSRCAHTSGIRWIVVLPGPRRSSTVARTVPGVCGVLADRITSNTIRDRLQIARAAFVSLINGRLYCSDAGHDCVHAHRCSSDACSCNSARTASTSLSAASGANGVISIS